MAEFLFLPVPTPEMTAMAEDIRQKRPGATILRNFWSKGFMKGVTRRLPRGGCLRGVGVLQSEGLSRTFVDLHLYCCGAGMEPDYIPNRHDENGLIVAPNTEFLKSFAQRVYEAGRPSFPQLRVTGYLGNVRAGAGDGIRVMADGVFIDNNFSIVFPALNLA